MGNAQELAAEQAFVDRAYEAAERRRERTEHLADSAATRSPRMLYERDERRAARDRRRLELELGDLPLCFGRLDHEPCHDAGLPETMHIGRLAVDDDQGDPLMVDWRAPVAAPFYRATAGENLGVARRRHLHCVGRRVRAIDDEVLGAFDAGGRAVVGEAALLRALDRRRTGRMGDVVATIQADQDRIVRAPLRGALVVQGGPGTGKTVVALHRVAYLLYTHRDELEAKGVLVIGPNAGFLRYIERVLPSLGESRVVYRTVDRLRDGPPATRADPDAVARIKGDSRMAEVLRRAVVNRQRPLRRTVTLALGAYQLRVGPRLTGELVAGVQALVGTHNERCPEAEQRFLALLHRQHRRAVQRAGRAGLAPAPPMSKASFVAVAAADPQVRAVMDRVWPELSAERLLGDLYRFPALWREAAEGVLTEAEVALVAEAAADGSGWSAADMALLDELDVVLGARPASVREATPREDRDWLADRVLEGVASDEEVSLSPTMAAEIRARIADDGVGRSEPERARSLSRGYGHVVVDEAQDLSPMEWRSVSRRCPRGSFTIVGDRGQASAGWGAGWHDVLATLGSPAGSELVELTVNYRTPANLMELAARVLASVVPDARPPESVRPPGPAPEVHQVDDDAVAVAVAAAEAAGRLVSALPGGTVAVIAPPPLLDPLRVALDERPETRTAGGAVLDDTVALVSPGGAKGLEFDGVVVVEPAVITGSTPAGAMGLYVALSRTTERLVLVHARPLPDVLAAALP